MLPRNLFFTLPSLAASVSALLSNATIDDDGGDPLTLKKPKYIFVDDAKWTALEATLNDCNPGCASDITQSQACWSCPPLDFNSSVTAHYTYWPGNGSDDKDSPNDRARVDIPFTGSAVYVYGIMNNKDDQAVKSKGITSSTYVTFMIDGVPVGSPFTHSPNNQLVEGTYWEFDVLMYANASLGCYGIHNLTIMNGGGTHKSAFLFDYIKYTFDDALESNTYSSYIPPTCPTPGSDANKGYNPASTTIPGYPAGPTSSTSGGSNGIPSPFQTGDPSGSLDNTAGHHSTSHSGKIAGIVVGVLAGLGIMGAILFLCCRRRKDDGGSKNWYKWEPGSPEALQNPQPPMTQQVGNAASLPHLTQDGVPAVDRRRSGVPPFLRRGSNWSIFGRQQSRITPFAGTGGVGRRNRPVNKLSIGDLKSPASITSTDDTTVANSVPFSPNSRFSEDNYFPVGTNITIPNRAPQVDPSTNSSSDESPTAAFTAQLHALAREVSLLRSEQGGMNQSHTGGLELPPVYEDHHEDDVLSSHDSRRT